MQVDTLVVFYHPARPGLHKRLRAEYRLPPAYVEASHPAAAILDGEQHGWSPAGLAVAPIHASVYYWEEVLKKSDDAKGVYNSAPSAYAKRIDLFITPRLAKTVEVAAVPEAARIAGWSFQATPAHTLLYTLLQVLDWGLNQPLRSHGLIRVYAEVSLAPPTTAQAIVEATRALAMLIAASRNQPVEYRVYTAPTLYEPSARKPPLVDLTPLHEEVFDREEAVRKALIEAMLEPPTGTPLRPLSPKARVPRELQRRIVRFAEKGFTTSKAAHAGLALAALAVACSERRPVETLQRILSEVVAADLENTVLQKYVEGGVLAHHLGVNTRHIRASVSTAIISAGYSSLCSILEEGATLEELVEVYRSTPTPASRLEVDNLPRLLERIEGSTQCNAREVIERRLAHPAVLSREGDRFRMNVQCLQEVAKAAAKA